MRTAVTGGGRPAKRVIWAVVLSAVLAALPGCGRRRTEATESTSYGTEGGRASTAQLFTVPAEQMSHVQVVAAELTPLTRILRLPGAVAYNNFETTPVITQVSGPVSRILVSPGEMVQKSQPMLEVASPDYAQARTAYLKARDAYDLAQKTYSRAKDLYDHHAVALADLQQAESARNQARADLQAATDALKVLGIQNLDRLARDPVSAEIPVLAPISGEVVERLVGPGQVIQSGATQVFTISNMKTVWVLVNVYEHDLGYIHLGEPVSIQTDAYPTTFHGRISYIASALDPNTRTLQVRIVTDNPGEKLKKDMYVTATVEAGTITNALTVPDSAVLRTPENQPFVYVATGPNQFAQRLVDVGESENGKTQIVDGLRPGERVAAAGSLFLQFANSLQR
jgi:cobalt-zinc-cadmium efflux system membrane fusion protein